jgi:hypothetical protein
MNNERTDFGAMKLLCMIPQWMVHVIIHLHMSIKGTIARVNSNINHGLWMMTCH